MHTPVLFFRLPFGHRFDVCFNRHTPVLMFFRWPLGQRARLDVLVWSIDLRSTTTNFAGDFVAGEVWDMNYIHCFEKESWEGMGWV